MQKKETTKQFNPITIYAAIAFCVVFLNILFIMFTKNEAKTTQLLKQELENLEQENRIITSAQEIYSRYASEVELISNVFPAEENIPFFIQKLEEIIRASSDEYTFKFTTVTPIKENDKLFLPLGITMKTDMSRFAGFLTQLETIPFMTHISMISSKSPDGFIGLNDIQLSLKVYVQNPFISP